MDTFNALKLFGGESSPGRRLVALTLADLSPGDVIIRVAYSSINYKDALASRGLNGIIRLWPRIGGIDLSGTVERSEDTRFKVGDRVVVHGFGMGVEHDGGHAQMARVPGDWVMHIPDGLTTFDAAAIGVAGYTAALSLHLMELNGVSPDQGPIIVTGATGGVGSIAIDMLTQRGYRAVAMTGKQNEAAYLQSLGAQDVLPRVLPPDNPKPLEKAQWAGALDSVGGAALAWLTRTMQPGGVIASFGNAGGMELSTTVLPFILRGIRLIGLVANSPMPLRQEVWRKIASIYRPRHLERIAHLIALEALPEYHDRTLAGQTRGRTVIDMSRTA